MLCPAFSLTTPSLCTVHQLLLSSPKTILPGTTTQHRHTMENYPTTYHTVEDKNSSCHIVEDYLTNPYQPFHLPASRFRSESASEAIGGQYTNQVRPVQTLARLRTCSGSSKRVISSKLYTKQRSAEEPGMVKTPIKDRLSSFRSRASSLSSYLSSTSSSIASSSSPMSSSLPDCENTSQFWNRYRRTPPKPSLGQLARQAIDPQIFKAQPDQEPEYQEVY